MVRILSADILIADVILPIHQYPELMQLVEQYKLQPSIQGKQANLPIFDSIEE